MGEIPARRVQSVLFGELPNLPCAVWVIRTRRRTPMPWTRSNRQSRDSPGIAGTCDRVEPVAIGDRVAAGRRLGGRVRHRIRRGTRGVIIAHRPDGLWAVRFTTGITSPVAAQQLSLMPTSPAPPK